MLNRRAALLLFAASLFALALASVARAANHYQYRLDRTDTTLARDSVANPADFTGAGWRGGAMQPDRTDTFGSCFGYNPKRSDLVVTGRARSVFHYRDLARLETRAQVFASGRMLDTDWHRSVLDPHFAPCLAASLPLGGKLMSLSELQLPAFAEHTAGWRAVLQLNTRSGAVAVVADVVMCAEGRREITVAQTAVMADAGTAAGMRIGEVRLARSLISRLEV